MKEYKKYILFIDYGSDGWNIWGSYESLDEAVENATKNNFGNDFMIVTKAKYIVKEIYEK